jgi:ankyrin repeat protein
MAGIFDTVASGDMEALAAALTESPALAASRHASGASLLAWAHYVGKPEAAPIIRPHLGTLDAYDAIVMGDLDAIDAQLAAGWDGNALSPDGFTPLGLAAFFRRPAIFARLLPLTQNLDDRAKNAQQVAALHAATARRDAGMVESLLRAGATPDLPQAGGVTALHAAARHGDAAIVALLLLFGADPGRADASGKDAVAHAREGGNDWLVTRLGQRRR